MHIGTGEDFRCPHCEQGMEVFDWDTEYGDPIQGDHRIRCVECREIFEIYVDVRVMYAVHKLR